MSDQPTLGVTDTLTRPTCPCCEGSCTCLTRAQIDVLEAAAREELREVEPVHAREERGCCLADAKLGEVVLYSWDAELNRVKREHMSRPEWSQRWRSDPVPPLPTRGVPNAGGVSPMLPGSEIFESVSAMERRYGIGPVYTPLTLRDPGLDAAGVIDMLHLRGVIAEAQLAAMNPKRKVTWARRGEWHGVRAMARLDTASALSDPSRGWCAGLLGLSDDDGDRRAFAGTSRDWRAMQRAHDRVMAETSAQWARERAEIVATQAAQGAAGVG